MKSHYSETYCVSSKEVLKEAIKASGETRDYFQINPYVLIIFSKTIINYLNQHGDFKNVSWLAPYHPYAGVSIHKGTYKNLKLTLVVPPMGASAIASTVEDLILCGAKVILLVCGAWSIKANINLLDFMIPTYTSGTEGTTTHYGRKARKEIRVHNEVVELLIEETKKETNKIHVGKNYSHEAFYRIDRRKLKRLSSEGYICMENGELNVLSTICNKLNIPHGAIFYNYISLREGWKVPWNNELYKGCVIKEAKIALSTIKLMKSSI
jgi:uridine phosphorylase